MALNKTVHPRDRTRFAKLSLVILEELTPLLQDILENEIPSMHIFYQVSQQKSLFQKLRPEQIIIIQNAKTDGYKDFDITLIYTLLRNLKCLKVTAPTQGWGTSQMPGNGETTLGDDIERIRLIRNKVVGHAAAPSLSETEFKEHWSNIASICKRMEIFLPNTQYLDRLLNAEMRSVDIDMESTYIEKIKEICSAEKSTKELLQSIINDKAPYVEETVRIKARNPRKRKIAKTYTDNIISVLNDLKNCITETTSDSEIEELYELIEEFVCGNEEDASTLISSPFFKRFKQKIKKYANLKSNSMQILSRHLRFLLKLKKKYGVDVDISKGSLQLKYTFSSERGYDLFMQDLQKGEIKKLVLSMVHYPPYLASFDLQTEDLTVHLTDNIAKFTVPLSHKPGFSATQISSITVPGVNGVNHICVVTSDRLWVSNESRRLLQVDSAGHVLHNKLRTLSMYTGSHTVTRYGDLLFIYGADKVCKLTSDGTVTTFLTTYWGAFCIHSSRINGDILVGSSDGSMTRYDMTGRELQVIGGDDKRQRLYVIPIYITDNQNGDILISDMNKHAVVVVDRSGRHRFNYTGRQTHFSPRGICTDIRGHVLVCDWFNDSVHLLDQDGQFLSLLLTREQHGIHRPTALCVDDQHNLYLGQARSNTIDVYKYHQDTDVK